MSLHCLTACLVAEKKSAAILIQVPLLVMSCFFWLTSRFSAFGFQFDYYIHLGVYVGACVLVCVFSLLGML